MKKAPLYLLLLCSLFLASFKKNERVTLREIKVKAPFKMPNITVPGFSKCEKLLITDFGAVSGNKAKNSQAIAPRIIGQKELPVENVSGKQVSAGAVHGEQHVQEHVRIFPMGIDIR